MSDDTHREIESHVDWSKVVRVQPGSLEGKHFPRAEDPVQMPSHYTQLPVECIDVTEHFGFCLGNAIKYIWRADHKGKPVEDLKKARWYIDREIARREKEAK